MRSVYYMDSDVSSNMAAPGDAVQLVRGHFEDIEAARVPEDTRWIDAAEEEELVGDVADELCSRVAVVEGGGEVDPVARDGDDAA